jgi:drug/metabolite transporter (DMT)-like permease
MANRQTHHLRGYLFALFATVLWSGNFIIARGLSGDLSPISLSFYRWSVAVLVFLPFSMRQLIVDFSTLMKHKLYICINALLGISLFNTLIYRAGHTTTAQNLSMIAITFPVFIVLISVIFLKEKISIRKIAGIIIVFFGATLLVNKGQISNVLNMDFVVGDFWMLLASLIFAIYSILLKFRPEGLRLIPFQLSTYILGLVFLTPFYLYEQISSPQIPFDYGSHVFIAGLYAGIFASMSAFVLWNKAISYIGPVKTGMMYYSLPVFSFIEAYFFLDETIHLYSILCLVLIVTGILLAVAQSAKNT